MTTQISTDNIQPAALATIGGGPKLANVQVTDSSYAVTGANTISTSGGYVRINGSGFQSNCNVLIGNVAATSVTYISSTQINSQIPALTAGSYIVYVVLTDNGKTALKPNGITAA